MLLFWRYHVAVLCYVRQQLLKTGAKDVNSLRLHVAKKFRLVSAPSTAYC